VGGGRVGGVRRVGGGGEVFVGQIKNSRVLNHRRSRISFNVN